MLTEAYVFLRGRMLLYALNVRQQQMSAKGTAVSLPAGNLRAALKNYLQYVMLFASSREEEPGYLGLVKILGVQPDPDKPGFIRIELGTIQRFEIPVTLAQIYRERDNHPFYRYAHPFRVVPDFELRRIFELRPRFALENSGFAEDTQAAFNVATLPKRAKTTKLVRSAAVRFEMLLHYGRQCPFTFELFESLDGLRCALQVGHLRPLRFGGKDHVQNVLPMAGLANWAWDEGLISLKNNGTLLLAAGLKDSARLRFDGCERIRFPDDARVWPKAENLEFHRDVIFQRSAAERDHSLQKLRAEGLL